MGKFEVTNAQYRKYNPKHTSKEIDILSLNEDNQPVVQVTYADAYRYGKWLTKKNGKKYEFRLPSEAEWEYACRAGTTTSRFWGNNPDETCKYANVVDATTQEVWKGWTAHNCDDGQKTTAPVGSFKPNAFGLHDMLGNVLEWTRDKYDKDAYSSHQKKNPLNIKVGTQRVYRGGSWVFGPNDVRCAFRGPYKPDYRNYYTGFRLIKTK
jgi:formylglycine-generating enzyme required for sulfatase activity